MVVVKLTFENENGKYKFFTSLDKLTEILKDPLFTETIVDPKSGEGIVHGIKIIDELGLSK